MTYTLEAVGSIKEIGKSDWDTCANPYLTDRQCGIAYDPFVSYHFLSALEESGSAAAKTGWAPYHLILSNNGICGVVPMYLKSHSQGEYVFDYNWADAFERAGGRYYPKLQISVPFTPAMGRRVLSAADADVNEVEEYLLSGVMQVAEKMSVSSVHVTFALKSQYERMGRLGFLQRTHKQFHWINNDYRDFDDFLSQLSSKKRKN
ncbi:MAG: peptidogalycan biosysnthesis protein, partial [Pseudomonadales bacterium]|nr:peptidogalycan biosysnthesis protein [Pseudomonadales bacterium]